MREEEKIDAGLLFDPSDPELRAIKRKTHDLNTEYNATLEGETERRAEILGEILGEFGEGGFIQGPIFFHYGKHTKIGKRFFGNLAENRLNESVGRIVQSDKEKLFAGFFR